MNLFSQNPDFYPTPKEVINTMLLGENVINKVCLEPSAGNGNIVRWLKENGAKEVIACEKETALQKLLSGECNLIAEDFFTVDAKMVSHIDYIIMNPPFSNAIQHIMHAFEIAPAGCTIIALCNSSNLLNAFSEERRAFKEMIELYGTSEDLGGVFEKSERYTDVEISLVKLYKEGSNENEFSGYMFSDEEDVLDKNETEGLVQYNVVRDMINRYISAVKLFDETMAAADKINSTARFSEDHKYLPIKFVCVDGNDKVVQISHDRYKKQLQKYYWRIIFDKLKMEKYATNKLREQINRFVEQQVNVPFTMHNIYKVLDMVVQTTGQRMNTALLEAFDLICSLSADNSTAGEKWKTNANYMVNKKFIVPFMTNYDSRYPTDRVKISYSSNKGKIDDVIKALCYLSGKEYNSKKENLDYFLYNNKRFYGEWFEFSFFRIKAFKKGTMHFEFLDEKTWIKFNTEVAKLRGWTLPKKSNKRK